MYLCSSKIVREADFQREIRQLKPSNRSDRKPEDEGAGAAAIFDSQNNGP